MLFMLSSGDGRPIYSSIYYRRIFRKLWRRPVRFLQPAPDAVLSRKYHQLKEKSHSQSAQPQQQQSTAEEVNNQPDQAQPKQNLSFGAAILQLLGIGLASPFLEMQDPFHGIIGLVILMIGIRIAWQITAGSRTRPHRRSI
jgi:hypothetical protein